MLGALFCIATTSSAPVLLREQAWTYASSQLAHALTHAPAECYAAPPNEIARASAERGRALFRSPALLGGPAARAGLSCEACHANGRANAAFFLPELTDRPGAADVTSEWSSKKRGDGVINPRRIPDLLDLPARGVFGRDHVPSLEAFVRGVIEDEFQGARPPPQAFADLMTYLKALKRQACPPTRETALSLAGAGADARRAADAAQIAEPETASLVLLAAQDAIGRIVERLPADDFADDRARLAALARELGQVRQAGAQMPAALASALPGWRARFDATVAQLEVREEETYFNAASLEAALAAP